MSVREEMAMMSNEKLVKTIKTLCQLTIILCVQNGEVPQEQEVNFRVLPESDTDGPGPDSLVSKDVMNLFHPADKDAQAAQAIVQL